MGANTKTLSATAIAYPAPLEASMARWCQTYAKFGGQAALPHARRVLDAAIKHSVVEIESIGDKKADPTQLNLKLANVILAHLFRHGKNNCPDFPSMDFEKHKLVVEGFNTFDALRENDLSIQDRVHYGRILEKPSLGLLARMVDITQYGRDGPASEKELAALNPNIFYFYNQRTGKTEYERIALAARKVYAPLADLLQFRPLAGELMSISYYHLNRGLYKTVKRTLAELQPKIAATKRVMDSVKGELEKILRLEGYEFAIITRDRKHQGKVMEKAERYSRKTGKTIEDEVRAMRDLAAFTVILHSRRGRAIAQNDIHEFENAASLIVGITHGTQPLRKGLAAYEMFNNMITCPKENGYQSFHVDMAFEDSGFTGLEAIIRNPRMHEYAASGGAAHYLYKGGGNEARVVERAYRNVMHAIVNGTSTHNETNDYRNSHNLLFNIDQVNRQAVVPNAACVGEALICAGVDLSRPYSVRHAGTMPSLFDPSANIDTLWVKTRGIPDTWEPLTPVVLEQLMYRSVLETTRTRLLEMRRCIEKRMDDQFDDARRR